MNNRFQFNHAFEEINSFESAHKGNRLTFPELRLYFNLYQNLKEVGVCTGILTKYLRPIIKKAFLSDEQDSVFITEIIREQINNDTVFKLSYFMSNFDFHSFETFIEFLLFHTNRQKALFSGQKLVALLVHEDYYWLSPLELAIEIQSSNLLRCLLRYGAVWSHLEGYAERIRRSNEELPRPSIMLCADIISLIVTLLDRRNHKLKMISKRKKLDDLNLSTCSELVSCGVLILRDMPNLQILQFRFLFNTLEKPKNIIKKMNKIIPGLENIFTEPTSLKHSCKLKIRYSLSKNHELPEGIYKLHLPKVLRDYLDLHRD